MQFLGPPLFPAAGSALISATVGQFSRIYNRADIRKPDGAPTRQPLEGRP